MKKLKFYIVSILFALLFFLPSQNLSAFAERGNRVHGNAMHGNQMHRRYPGNYGAYNRNHNLNGIGNGPYNSGAVIEQTPTVVVPANPAPNPGPVNH